MDEQHLLTRREAAAFLRISLSKLDMLRACGMLPFVRIGDRVLISRHDALDMCASNRIVACAPMKPADEDDAQ